jgi:hypothetical protein
MESGGKVWRLLRGDVVVADFTVREADFPWLNADVTRHEGFADVADLFAEDIRALDRVDEDGGMEALDSAVARIQQETRLTYPDGRAVPEFLLHIEGDEAWWRWSDEPFDAPESARSGA